MQPHHDGEVLVKLREEAGSMRKAVERMHALSARRPKMDDLLFLGLPLTCLSLQYQHPVWTASNCRKPTVRKLRTIGGRRVASTGPF
jgi:hypothetical protein